MGTREFTLDRLLDGLCRTWVAYMIKVRIIQRSGWREEFHSFGARGSYFIYLGMEILSDLRISDVEQRKGISS